MSLLFIRFGDGTEVFPRNTPYGNAREGSRRQPRGLTLFQCLASALDVRTKDLFWAPALEHDEIWSALSTMAVSLAVTGCLGLPTRQGDTPIAQPILLLPPPPHPLAPQALPVLPPAEQAGPPQAIGFTRRVIPVAAAPPRPVIDLRAHTTTLVCLEIDNFKEVPVQPELTINTLEWWDTNSQSFPNLARVARLVLAVPATSAPSERMWSEAGLVVRAKRASMDPANVAMTVFYRAVFHFEERYGIVF